MPAILEGGFFEGMAITIEDKIINKDSMVSILNALRYKVGLEAALPPAAQAHLAPAANAAGFTLPVAQAKAVWQTPNSIDATEPRLEDDSTQEPRETHLLNVTAASTATGPKAKAMAKAENKAAAAPSKRDPCLTQQNVLVVKQPERGTWVHQGGSLERGCTVVTIISCHKSVEWERSRS